VSQNELDFALSQIIVETDYTFGVFDPKYYHKNKSIQQKSVQSTTRLEPKISLVRVNSVSLTSISFLNSILYNPPYLDGLQIKTFSTSSNIDINFEPLEDSTTLDSLGYLSAVLVQD